MPTLSEEKEQDYLPFAAQEHMDALARARRMDNQKDVLNVLVDSQRWTVNELGVQRAAIGRIEQHMADAPARTAECMQNEFKGMGISARGFSTAHIIAIIAACTIAVCVTCMVMGVWR